MTSILAVAIVLLIWLQPVLPMRIAVATYVTGISISKGQPRLPATSRDADANLGDFTVVGHVEASHGIFTELGEHRPLLSKALTLFNVSSL